MNIHLDVLLMACVYEWKYANKFYINLQEVCSVYNDKVLFPMPNMRAEVLAYIEKFGSVITDTIKMLGCLGPSKKGEPNSTPVHNSQNAKKPRRISTLEENILLNLEKKSSDGLMHGLGGIQRDPEIYTTSTHGNQPARLMDLFNLGSHFGQKKPVIAPPTTHEEFEVPAKDSSEKEDNGVSGSNTPDFQFGKSKH